MDPNFSYFALSFESERLARLTTEKKNPRAEFECQTLQGGLDSIEKNEKERRGRGKY